MTSAPNPCTATADLQIEEFEEPPMKEMSGEIGGGSFLESIAFLSEVTATIMEEVRKKRMRSENPDFDRPLDPNKMSWRLVPSHAVHLECCSDINPVQTVDQGS